MKAIILAGWYSIGLVNATYMQITDFVYFHC